MGPGCFYPGNRFIRRTNSGDCLLQWGRDVSIPEMSSTTAALAAPGAASMGPGCFYPGNPQLSIRYISAPLGFNGAGMFLSRKSIFPRNPPLLDPASMGPGCFYPGNKDGLRSARRSRGFNGAGMFLSRKFRIGNDCDSAVHASMGPGCFYPGNGRRSTCWRTGPFASMGPGCFYPGNGAVHVGQAVGIELQWGRDVSIPEMSVGFWLLLRCNRFNGAGMFLSRK